LLEFIVSDDLLVERRGRALWLILNRPEKYNAFTWETRDEIFDVLTSSDADEADAIVLTGRGRGFCTGIDLDAVLLSETGKSADARRDQLERTHRVVTRMRHVKAPVIALVNGVAAGGGWSLALAADYILAVDDARFVTAFTKLALVPDLGGSYFLTQRVGATRAKSIILRGQTIGAVEALAMGLVDELAPGDQLEERLAARMDHIIGLGKRQLESVDAARPS
jgi:2-(1,2-epoxy-1,2-dihydrophenyl)acetyl-CoA isomerase